MTQMVKCVPTMLETWVQSLVLSRSADFLKISDNDNVLKCLKNVVLGPISQDSDFYLHFQQSSR